MSDSFVTSRSCVIQMLKAASVAIPLAKSMVGRIAEYGVPRNEFRLSSSPAGDKADRSQSSAPVASRWSAPLRWGAVILVAEGLRRLVGQWTTSPSETFWACLPLVILTAAALRVIPPPKLNSESRAGRVAILLVLALAPTLFSLALTRLTQSRFSWWECVVATYFFGCCLELPLLYVFQFRKGCGEAFERRWPGWRARIASGAMTLGIYLLLFPLLLATLAVHRPKLLPDVSGPEFQVASLERVEFSSRGSRPLRLRGDFQTRPNSRGTMIVCHGVGANRRDISAITQLVHEAGYQVLAFDFRGHGESAGRTITYGANERLDVLGAYDYCLSRSDVDPGKLYAIGVSMGGSSLLLALPDMPRVQAAIIDSAFADLPAMVDHQLRFFPQPLRGPLHRVTALAGWCETGFDIETIRPIDALPRIAARLQFIHGTEDFIVPPSHSERMHAAAPGSLLHLEPFAPHIGTAMLNPAEYRRLLNTHCASTDSFRNPTNDGQ